jgi:hypothetical protein
MARRLFIKQIEGKGLATRSRLLGSPLPSAPPAAASNDPFGEEVTLVEKTIVYISGSGVWDSAF